MNTKFSHKKRLEYGKIMGIKVLVTQKSEVLASVEERISYSGTLGNRNQQFFIVTPNPELVLMAQKNKELRNALNSADLPVPDGIGLAQAYKFLSMPAPKNLFLRFIVTFCQGVLVGGATFLNKRYLTKGLEIIKGREFFLKLIKYADRNKLKVFFLGGESGEAEKAAKKLSEKHKNIRIEYFQGPIVNKSAVPILEKDRKLQEDAVDKINKFSPDFLFVAMQNPKQEIWIHKNLSKLNVRGAMTVGGTFRYISGMSKLPPKWMETLGLEWVFRLITEPYRIRRIFNAWPMFPLNVWMWKIKNSSL